MGESAVVLVSLDLLPLAVVISLFKKLLIEFAVVLARHTLINEDIWSVGIV